MIIGRVTLVTTLDRTSQRAFVYMTSAYLPDTGRDDSSLHILGRYFSVILQVQARQFGKAKEFEATIVCSCPL